MFGFGKSQKSVVGLDIGSSAVKAVELKAVGKGFKVVAFAIESVPPDSIGSTAVERLRAGGPAVLAQRNLLDPCLRRR